MRNKFFRLVSSNTTKFQSNLSRLKNLQEVNQKLSEINSLKTIKQRESEYKLSGKLKYSSSPAKKVIDKGKS